MTMGTATATTTSTSGASAKGEGSIGRPRLVRSERKLDRGRGPARQTILRELPVCASDITDKDVIEFAKQIGIDPESESDLLWIAKKGLLANLPAEWLPVEDDQERIYYFNTATAAATWEHPVDTVHRSLAESERQSKRSQKNCSAKAAPSATQGIAGSSVPVSMSGLTSLANLHFVEDDFSFKSSDNDNGIGNELRGIFAISPDSRRTTPPPPLPPSKLSSSGSGSSSNNGRDLKPAGTGAAVTNQVPLHNSRTVKATTQEERDGDEVESVEEEIVESVDFELDGVEEAIVDEEDDDEAGEELSFNDDEENQEEEEEEAGDENDVDEEAEETGDEEEEEGDDDDDGEPPNDENQVTVDLSDGGTEQFSEIYSVRLSAGNADKDQPTEPADKAKASHQKPKTATAAEKVSPPDASASVSHAKDPKQLQQPGPNQNNNGNLRNIDDARLEAAVAGKQIASQIRPDSAALGLVVGSSVRQGAAAPLLSVGKTARQAFQSSNSSSSGLGSVSASSIATATALSHQEGEEKEGEEEEEDDDDDYNFDLGDDDGDPFAEFDLKQPTASSSASRPNNNVGLQGGSGRQSLPRGLLQLVGEELVMEDARRSGTDRKSSAEEEEARQESLVGFRRRKEETKKDPASGGYASGSGRAAVRTVRDVDEDVTGKSKQPDDDYDTGDAKRGHEAKSGLMSTDSNARKSNQGPVAAGLTGARSNPSATPKNLSAQTDNEEDMDRKIRAISSELKTQMDEKVNEIRGQMVEERTKISKSLLGMDARLESVQGALDRTRRELVTLEQRKDVRTDALEAALATAQVRGSSTVLSLSPPSAQTKEEEVHDCVNSKPALQALEAQLLELQTHFTESLRQSMSTLRDQVSKQISDKSHGAEESAASLVMFEELRLENEMLLKGLKKDLSELSSSKRALVDRYSRLEEEVDKNSSEVLRLKNDVRQQLQRQETRFDEEHQGLAVEIEKVRSSLRKELNVLRDALDTKSGLFFEATESAARESREVLERLNNFKVEQEKCRQQVKDVREKVEENSCELASLALKGTKSGKDVRDHHPGDHHHREMGRKGSRVTTMTLKEREADAVERIEAVKEANQWQALIDSGAQPSLSPGDLASGQKPRQQEQPELDSRLGAVEESVSKICIALEEIKLVCGSAPSRVTPQPSVATDFVSVKADTRPFEVVVVNRKREEGHQEAAERRRNVSPDDLETNGRATEPSETNSGEQVSSSSYSQLNEAQQRQSQGSSRRTRTRTDRNQRQNKESGWRGRENKNQYHSSNLLRPRTDYCSPACCSRQAGNSHCCCHYGGDIRAGNGSRGMGNYGPFVGISTTRTLAPARSSSTSALAKAPRADFSRYRDIRASSSSLLSLIKRTTKILKQEAGELASLGNYQFTQSHSSSELADRSLLFAVPMDDFDQDEEAIKKLKLVRGDVNEKLKRLSSVIKQNN